MGRARGWAWVSARASARTTIRARVSARVITHNSFIILESITPFYNTRK